MIYRNRPWHRQVQSFSSLIHWLKEQIVDCIPNGHILILAGTVLVAGVMIWTLVSFLQGSSQVENDALNMMQTVQTPSAWGDAGIDNPLMQNILTGGFVLIGMLALGAVLVCLDRTRANLMD